MAKHSRTKLATQGGLNIIVAGWVEL
jgi:hypothetical protein